MGARKREMAERQKEIKNRTAVAKLNDVPTSPRKMRLVADIIRGKEVNNALDILKYSKKEPATRLSKLVRSAIANWEAKRTHLEAHPSLPSGPCRSHPQAQQPRHHRSFSQESNRKGGGIIWDRKLTLSATV